jgi:hypothetical protein
MKSRTVISLIALAAALAFGLAGCALIPITIEARLTRFIDELNASDRASVYLNFSSTATEYYETIKAGLYWDTPFPAGAAADLPYSKPSTIDLSDPTAVLVTISGPPLFGGPKDFKFVMINEPTSVDDWKIHEVWIWNPGTSLYDVLIK